MVSRLVASVWCKPTRAAGVRRVLQQWSVRRVALHTTVVRVAAAGRVSSSAHMSERKRLICIIGRIAELVCDFFSFVLPRGVDGVEGCKVHKLTALRMLAAHLLEDAAGYRRRHR